MKKKNNVSFYMKKKNFIYLFPSTNTTTTHLFLILFLIKIDREIERVQYYKN